MILTSYVDFRFNFGVPATTDADGHPIFWAKQDPAKLFTFRPFNAWDYDPVWSPGGLVITGHEIDLTINAGNPTGKNDVSPFVDEWHWYLSCPGAATSGGPRWEIVRNDPGGGQTRSGRVTLQLTALGEALHSSHVSDLVSAMLTDVHIYAIHIANEVVWIDAHQCAFAPDSRPVTWPL
jgi:hypothetical protein